MFRIPDAPAIQQAFEQLDRFYADPKLMELDRQRRFAMFDQMAINAAEAKGKADSVVFLLRKRFQIVPQDVQTKLMSMKDIEQLDHLIE